MQWSKPKPLFCDNVKPCEKNDVIYIITGLCSTVVRVSAYGTGGAGFDSRGRVIPKTLKMVVMASLLGAQELRVSITTDS